MALHRSARSSAPARISFLTTLVLTAVALGLGPRSVRAQSLVAEWRFDEPSWTGASNEILDSSGNARHATKRGNASPASSLPARSGNPGTCGYAVLSGDGDDIEIPSMKSYSATSALTYAVWMRPTSSSGTRHVMGMDAKGNSGKYTQMAIYLSGGLLYGRAVTNAGTYTVSTSAAPLDQWKHVALTFNGTRLVLYVDAQAVAQRTFAAATLVASQHEFSFGQFLASKTDPYLGAVDEARVFASALDANAVAQVMQDVHSCGTTPTVRLTVVHDGQGTSCQTETIGVRALDGVGNPVSSYSGAITLDTQTGAGTWSLLSGGGAFADATPEDGIATYTFSTADRGEASFGLRYGSGPSPIDVDVYGATGRDDDSEGPLAFSPATFTLTAHAVPSPPPSVIADPIDRRIAGSAFDVHITASGGPSGGSSCGAIQSYEGSKALRFFVEYADPASAPSTPSVDGRSVATSEASATPQSVQFSGGRAVVSVKYKDTGRIGIQVVDGSQSPPLRGSTGSFVSLPADLLIVSVKNAGGEANPAVAVPDGPLFVRAGEPFQVIVDALDAEGSRTPSFGRESSAEGIRLASSALVAPAGGRNGTSGTGTIGNATSFSADALPGRFVGKAFSFDEVGAIRLQASVADGDYLGAGAVLGTESGTVGRFAPSRFTVTTNAPRFATTCPVGAFTWMGQPFGYAVGFETELVVTAVNGAGGTTANYFGDWFRLTNASLAARTYRAASATVDATGLPAAAVDPAIVSNGDGTARLRFSTGTGLALIRDSPVAPFDAEIELSIDVLDADATAYPGNPFRVGGTTTGNGIAFDVAKRFQYGRLRLDNAFGSELVRLPMRLRTQRFDGTAFADDDADSCSRIPATALVLSPSPSSLVAIPDLANVPLFSGDAGLTFAAPRASGEVDVRLDLGASGANLPWLRADWPEDGNLDGVPDDDPRARATFGIWEGRDALIFQRELY